MLHAPSGYASWRKWLSGKALPLTLFSLLLVGGSLNLPREMTSLARDGVRLYPALELCQRVLTL